MTERFLHRMVVATLHRGRARVWPDDRRSRRGAPGVFVAGDWVGPIGMLSDASFASAEAAALAAVAHVTRARTPAR